MERILLPFLPQPADGTVSFNGRKEFVRVSRNPCGSYTLKMPEIRVEVASTVPWADVEHSLTGGGDGGSCWCQWFTIPRKDFNEATSDERRELLRREVVTRSPSPGLVAYVDDEAAAWMRVGPRISQPALLRARVVTAGSGEPADDPGVWAITCFVVRRQFRGLGVAKRLVNAGTKYAAVNGARLVEAYPFDTEQRPRRVNELYVGTADLFRGQGFVETARPTDARVVMTKALPVTT
jgi:ribosomal protein S18 acetylase RimI-like enzyme